MKPIVLRVLLAFVCASAHAQITPPPDLKDELTGQLLEAQPLSETTRNLVIAIHGWNNPPQSNRYAESSEWAGLVSHLKLALNSTGSDPWALLLYDWHEDADTGIVDFSLSDWLTFALPNATQAAINARAHGDDLGPRLPESVRRVHLIAHSAGAWAARQTAKWLIENRPYVVAQITLLDPFIPEAVPGAAAAGLLSVNAMSEMAQWTGNDRILSLENYFADDFPPGPGQGLAGFTLGTQVGTFSWGTRGTDLQVEWDPDFLHLPGVNRYYDFHSGPILFFGDTVSAAGGGVSSRLPPGITPYAYYLYGWYNSLFYLLQDSALTFTLPRIAYQPQKTTSVLSGAPVTLTAHGHGSAPLAYQWFKRGQASPIAGATSSSYTFIASDITKGDYVVRISNNIGKVFSDLANVSLTTTPTRPSPPSFLSTTAVSSSRIDLTWTNVANETGYKLERRVGSSEVWSQLPAFPANVTAFSDTGRAAGTAYSYRIFAFNAAGDSDYSPTASATTLAGAGTTYTLSFASSNPASGVKVSSFVGNGNFAFSITPENRSFPSGAEVGVTCPSTLVGGLVFQKWRLDGNDHPSSADLPTYTTVTMAGPHTLTAVFGAAPLPPKVLSSLTIEGPSTVDERSTAPYKARAAYTDGSVAYVTAAWHDDSSYASISSAGLLDTDAVSSDRDITIDATFAAGGVTKTRTKNVTIRNTDAVATYTLTRNVVGLGEIGYSPRGSSYAAGTRVSLHANDGERYVFSHWSGDASGTEDDIEIAMTRNKSVTAHFVVDTTVGNIDVTLLPALAAAEGAAWKYHTFTAWRASGDGMSGLSPRTGKYVYFKDIPGWITPDSFKADIIGGQTTQLTATYREIPGSVQVTIEPADTVTAGAHWRLDGGAWQASAASIAGVTPGAHQIEFQTIPSWATPATQPVTVQRGGSTIVLGQYSPPPGLALINSVSPKIGPIEGGTLLTIEGANFSTNTAVSIGGQPASNVTFVSTTRVTAVTPPSSVFGSAKIIVTTGTSSATNANGFAYGIPRGTNMTLITSSGGNYQAVACNSQYLFIGQGTTLSIFDISTPSSPIFRGSVAVPGLIQDIALSGSFAIVAANDAGVHVVDVSNVSAPTLRGFYSTTGPAYALEVLAGRAYVVDRANGLVILDVTNPDGPVALSSLTLGSFNWDIALRASAAGFHAYVSARDKVYVVEIGDPTTPVRLAELAVSSRDYWSIALAGNLAFLGSLGGGVGVVDISDPAHPVNVGPLFGTSYVTVASVGNRVVLGGWTQSFDIVDVSGTNTTLRGSLPSGSVTFSANSGQRMATSDGKVWIAAETAVFGVNISNPDAPQRIFRKDDQGGRFEKLAVSGSTVAGSTSSSLLGFSYSGNSLSQIANLAREGGIAGLVSQQSVLLDFRNTYYADVQGGKVQRASLQSGSLFQPLAIAVTPQMSVADAYPFNDRLVTVAAARTACDRIRARSDTNGCRLDSETETFVFLYGWGRGPDRRVTRVLLPSSFRFHIG